MPVDPIKYPNSLIQSLYQCPLEHLQSWLKTHRAQLDRHFFQSIKEICLEETLKNPKKIDTLTQNALIVANNIDEPLAQPLANWARGIWGIYNAPDEAVGCFEQAIQGFSQQKDTFSVACLQTNLMAVLTEQGRFLEAVHAYQQALPEFMALQPTEPYYFMRLEQNYGWLLHNQGDYEQALAAYQRVLELATKHYFPVVVTEIQVNRVLALGMLGRLTEGESILLNARLQALQGEQQLTVARIDMNLAELYTALGLPAQALHWFKRSYEKFSGQDVHMEEGSVLMREAVLLQRIGAWRSARDSCARALMIFTQHEMQPQVGQILIQYAGVCRIAHEFSRAEELLRQAEAIWMERNHKFWLITVLFERINLALAQQKVTTALALLNTPLLLEQTNAALTAQRELLMAECLRQIPNDPVCQTQAQAHFDRVWSYALAQDNRWLQRETTAGLGQLLRHTDPDSARDYLERAVQYDDETRQMLSIEELKASFHLQASNILPILIRMAVSQGHPNQALSYAWKAKASAFADLVRFVTLQHTLTVAEQAEIQQIRQQIAARRWTLAKNASGHLGDSFQEIADPTLQELEQRLYALRRQRNREHNYSDDHLFADPAQTLAGMDADSLLEYVRCDNEILAIYADRYGTWKVVWLCEEPTIQDILDDLQLNMQNVVYQHHENRVQFNDVWCAEALPLLERAYDLLIRPVLAEIEPLHLDHKLLIAPCEPLFLLPFAALWNGQQYLFEQVCLEFIPSGGLLDVPIHYNPAQTLSCPVIVASSSEGTLRGTHAEVAAIAATLPEHNALVDSPQTLDILNNLSTPPRLLHLAAHSIVRTDAPILSAIQLTEDILSVEQCYELPLIGTELVVLSGCTTMTGLDTGGALLAFQSAFFIAGVKRILSSLWPIADDVTPVLMSHFYRLLIKEQLLPPAALRKTQQILIKDPAYNHPAIWAAFVCTRR